jgi:hypothetical protein
MDWFPWIPLAAASLHICEEFAIPGGFPAWYRRYRAESSRVTPRFLVIVNAALLIACLDIALLGHRLAGYAYWLTIAAVLASNGIWHAWASYRSRSYSPGTVTGLLLYVPLAGYGLVHLLGTGAVSATTAVVACLIGGSYHFWSAAYHGVFRRGGLQTGSRSQG